VAIANFFAQVGLTALLGQASTPLSQITAGSANVWSIAANFASPIYEGGALTAQKRQALAAWQQAKLQYEETALNAFTDVSNARISRQQFERIRIDQARSVAVYQEAVTVSLQRYTAWRASYFEVLEAQQQLYPQQNLLARTELNRRLVVVQLYLALGGGWNLTDSGLAETYGHSHDDGISADFTPINVGCWTQELLSFLFNIANTHRMHHNCLITAVCD
jgi:outer membrane protein, multidrug efflux system